MQNDVELHVMNRGLLSDEFIGYVPVPLNQFGVYERPESRYDIPQPGWYGGTFCLELFCKCTHLLCCFPQGSF